MATLGNSDMLMDINADVGEGHGDDAALMPFVTSASIACGGHVGDATSMQRTVALAVEHGVAIGAHVSYPDKEGFGRRSMSLPAAALTAQILQQLRALGSIARAAGSRIRYLKAHGALYNSMVDDAGIADAVIRAIGAFDTSLAMLTLPDSIAMQRAQAQGVEVFGEAFADRTYTQTARLVPRSQAEAVITDAAAVARQAVALATTGRIMSANGVPVSIRARSLCVHGDTPGAAELAQAVRVALQHAGIEVRAFT